MKNPLFKYTTVVLVIVCLCIYLFVTAPPPLDTSGNCSSDAIPIDQAFLLLAHENNVVRTLYTQDIVAPGTRQGMRFAEHWRDNAVHAGPLPALFLRETAAYLEAQPIQLGLFLGSDFPLTAANAFSGDQAQAFARVKRERTPVFFFVADTGMHAAMFADIAIAEACIDCHNHHPHAPKSDWALGDVMGATTWTYPKAVVSTNELLTMLQVLRRGFTQAYTAFLTEAADFPSPPEIGDRWPVAGNYLPTPDVFMRAATERSSSDSLRVLLSQIDAQRGGDAL